MNEKFGSFGPQPPPEDENSDGNTYDIVELPDDVVDCFAELNLELATTQFYSNRDMMQNSKKTHSAHQQEVAVLMKHSQGSSDRLSKPRLELSREMDALQKKYDIQHNVIVEKHLVNVNACRILNDIMNATMDDMNTLKLNGKKPTREHVVDLVFARLDELIVDMMDKRISDDPVVFAHMEKLDNFQNYEKSLEVCQEILKNVFGDR